MSATSTVDPALPIRQTERDAANNTLSVPESLSLIAARNTDAKPPAAILRAKPKRGPFVIDMYS